MSEDKSAVSASEALARLDEILSGLPDLPVPLFGLISDYLTKRRIKRLELAVDAFKQRLARLSVAVQQDRLASDQYLHLSVLAFERLQNEHRMFKLRCFGNFMAESLVDRCSLDFEKYHHLLECIDKLGFRHIVVLHELAKLGVRAKEDENWTTWEAIEGFLMPHEVSDQDMLIAALSEMAGLGLIKTKGKPNLMFGTNPVGLWKVSTYSVTVLGISLMELIDEPENIDGDQLVVL